MKQTKKALAQRERRHRFPEAHLRCTEKEWRQKKRQQWKALMHALSDFEWGSAYTPVVADLYELKKLATRMQEDLQEDWIAW